MLYILYLDTEHVSDPLFLEAVAQQFHKHPVGHRRALIVHGSSEKVERTFEAEGHFIERENGLLPVDTDEQRRLVERDLRETNQSIVATLTDQVVPTVGVQGTDRQLLRRTDDGTIAAASNLGWLDALLKQHVVAVVSSMIAPDPDTIAEEVPLPKAAAALAHYFAADAVTDDPPVRVVLFHPNDTPGLQGEEGTVHEVCAPTHPTIPHKQAVHTLAEADVPMLLTNTRGFFEGDAPTGTRIASVD
ncbi:MAG: acetylglutamate kinase [Longimonas sp.]|uniref:acetylglutamate kinase n=1 Tax=Longimonas sp. TaxID=2039626 RepID=UPI0039755616